MWRPSDKTKLTASYKYVELMRFMPTLDPPRPARVMTGPKDNRVPLLVDVDELGQWRSKQKNLGLYTTVFHYASPEFDEHAKRLGNLHFDLDGEGALLDAVKLLGEILKHAPEDAVRLYFTGKKGFHIEVEAFALGLSPSTDLHEMFRYIAAHLRDKLDLTTLDFSVYDSRRMWRLVNSIHQESHLYKIPLQFYEMTTIEAIREMAELPRYLEVPDQKFSLEANSWYREFTYMREAEAQQRQESGGSSIDRFLQHGTGLVKSRHDDLVFDPVELMNNCPAIKHHWEEAERTHDLSHEARLFLCSILSYTDEAIDYLHAILSNCHDYDPRKSQAHIDDWIRRREMGIGGRPYSCERANAAGVGCGNCQLEVRHKWEVVGDKLVQTDEVSSPSSIRFAYCSPETLEKRVSNHDK